MFSKKLKKLIFKPKLFFNDSWFFNANNKTKELLSGKRFNCKNIFIISNLGQLKKAEEFIRRFNKRNNGLIVLATEKNLQMPKIILEQMEKKLFLSANLLVIPVFPNSFSFQKAVWFHNVYKHIVDVSNARHAYFMSYEYHYAIFLSLFKQKNIRCSLIEEGTGTYKRISQSRLANINLFSGYLNAMKSFRYPDLRYEKVYGSFPELLKETFQAKEFVEFTNVPSVKLSPKVSMVISKYNLTSHDIIYVNQKYAINQTLFAKSLISILQRLHKDKGSRVFIKLHPKEPVKNVGIISKAIKQAKCKDIILITEPDFLIEPVIKKFKIKMLIGLTSSSLVYSPLISKKCQPYSIAPLMLELCNNEQSKKGIITLSQHFDILKNFKNVRVITSFTDPVFKV